MSDVQVINGIFTDLILKRKSLITYCEVPYILDKPASSLIHLEKLAGHEDVVCDGFRSLLNQSCDRYYGSQYLLKCLGWGIREVR